MIAALHDAPNREPSQPLAWGVNLPMRHISRLKLSAFRSLAELDLRLAPAPVVLVGPNGSGKTSVLEALSAFAPGTGLRGAKLSDATMRGSNAASGWAVHAELNVEPGESTRIGVGLAHDAAGRERRIFRKDGEAAKSTEIAGLLPLAWMTPALELTIESSAGERRRFFDRLVATHMPAHAAHLSAYERAMRQRQQVLQHEAPDAAWLTQLELSAAERGAEIAHARLDFVSALQSAIDAGGPWPNSAFPRARIHLRGDGEAHAQNAVRAETAAHIGAKLLAGRALDTAAGRSLYGVHRSEFQIEYAQKNLPGDFASSGEQAALLLNILLANAQIATSSGGAMPMLLLDETAARLDAARRGALFEALGTFGTQTFLTGPTREMFRGLAGAHFIMLGDGGNAGGQTQNLLS